MITIKQLGYEKDNWVFVHDAARPAVSLVDVTNLYESVKTSKGQCGILAISAFETVKKVSGAKVVETLDRNNIWLAQTPQLARFNHLEQAFKYCENNGLTAKVTDEASALELFGDTPIIVEGSRKNIKITTKEDLDFIDWVFANKLD